MDPQGGESNNNQPPAVNAAAVVDSSLSVAVEPNVAASNPLDKLEGMVAAAKLEAGAVQPTASIQAPEETPKGQFENQFGSGPDTSPVAESVPGLIDTSLANLGSTPPPAGEDVSSNIQQSAEVIPTPQPEETSLDPKQKFINTVAAAYEELKASEEKNTASS